jgi:tight adherence protein B
MTMALLLSIVIGAAIVIVVLSFMVIGHRDTAKQIERRLQTNAPAQGSFERAASAQLIRDEGLSTLPWLDRTLASWSRIDYVRRLLSEAGMETKPGQILLKTGVLGLAAYLILHIIFDNAFVSLICAMAFASIPIGSVYVRRSMRLRAFEKNFPEAIDLLARAVRSGHSLNTGMEIVGQEMAEPIAGEFRKIFEEQRLGLHFRETLIHLTERVPLQDVRFFAAALIIQDETGGNLAEILSNLSATVRDRFKIRGDVRVRTASGRLTAVILSSLPPMMLVMMNIVNPDYSHVLYTDIYGLIALAVAAGMQIIGALILWKIVNIQV